MIGWPIFFVVLALVAFFISVQLLGAGKDGEALSYFIFATILTVLTSLMFFFWNMGVVGSSPYYLNQGVIYKVIHKENLGERGFLYNLQDATNERKLYSVLYCEDVEGPLVKMVRDRQRKTNVWILESVPVADSESPFEILGQKPSEPETEPE